VTHDQEEALSISDRIVVMSKGRIEQIGTPLEIYNAPKTPFVASFVGTLNLLHATVVDGQQGRVAVGDQVFNTGRHIDGQTVTLAVRPEAFALSSTSDGANHLQGTVEETYFLGSVLRLRVNVGTQAINVDVFNNQNLQAPQRGERLTLYFMPEAAMLVEDKAQALAVEV
jgi:putative spermidine/putrescine transport system ATP-binding protein